MEARHIPCWKFGQYGHLKAECKNEAICIKCGGKPGACNHAFNANVLYCATCGDNDHYTGQVRCRLYPRNETPQPDNRPMPLPPQTTNSPQKPSATDFPALIQNVWKTRQAEQDLDCNTTETTPKDTSEKTFTDKLHDTIKATMTEAMETTMRLVEEYVDEKITQAVDQMVKFTMTLVNNMIKAPQTQTLQQTANNTAKKTLEQ